MQTNHGTVLSSSPLAGWVSFYEVIGSSAGALTGLQFVVMTLIAGSQVKGTMREVRAFGTPTVVHFCAALLVSAIMSAPWPALSNVSVCLSVCGVAGAVYSLTLINHANKANYSLVAEDWIWYVAVPLAAYMILATGAILLRWFPIWPLFAIAATTILFLLAGIHNAWDTVTYIAVQKWQDSGDGKTDEAS